VGEQLDKARFQRELVSQFLIAGTSQSPPPFVKGPIFQGELSKVFYAETPSCPHALAVKLCISPSTGLPNPADAAEQFRALQAIAPLMPNDQPYAVPQPFKLDAPNGLVAIEWIDGRTLTSCLKDFHFPIDQVLAILQRAGIWLRYFHATRHEVAATLDAAEQFRELAASLAASALRSDRAFMRAYRAVERGVSGIATQAFPRALLHGDFKTDNLMLSGDRMIGLDIQSRHKNLVLWDIVPFLNRLGLFFYSPRGLRLLLRRQEIEKRFLLGYFERELQAQEAAAIAWLRLLILLRQWDERGIALATNRLKRAVNNWTYRREANRLSAALSRAAI
jgi:Ser/Thr protein kinase RdoA (MazF antagonist)